MLFFLVKNLDFTEKPKEWESFTFNPLIENTILFYLKSIAILTAIILMIIMASCWIVRMKKRHVTSGCQTVAKGCTKHSKECKCPRKIMVIYLFHSSQNVLNEKKIIL